jgi:hypothetical protein
MASQEPQIEDYKNHADKRKRSMISLACENCRTSHLKCDGAHPCVQCRKRKGNCVYSIPKRRGRKPINKEMDLLNNGLPYIKSEMEKNDSPNAIWKNPTKFASSPVSTPSPQNSVQSPNNMTGAMEVPETPAQFIQKPSIPNPGNTSGLQLTVDPYTQHLALCSTLSAYLSAYVKYLHFIHPFFKIPNSGSLALSLISVPFEQQSRKERIYNMALNTILALGSLLLRNAQHADEFVQCATVIAKDFMFETKDYQIASGYSLLSYYFHLQMEKDKAVVLNTLAYNICKNLKALDTSPVGVSCMLAKTALNNLDYTKKLRLFSRLMHQRVAPNKMFFTIIVQTFSRMKYESNPDFKSMLQYLDHTEKHVLPMFHDNENDYEINVYRVLLWSTRSAVFWRAKMKEQALEWADQTLKLMINNPELKYFPVSIVNTLESLVVTHLESGQFETAEKEIELLTVVTWQKHVKNVLERISKLCSERDIQLNLLKNKHMYGGGSSPDSSDPMQNSNESDSPKNMQNGSGSWSNGSNNSPNMLKNNPLSPPLMEIGASPPLSADPKNNLPIMPHVNNFRNMAAIGDFDGMPNSFGSPVIPQTPQTPTTPTTPMMINPGHSGHSNGFKGRPDNVFPYFVENGNAVHTPFSEYPYNDFTSPPNSRMSGGSSPDSEEGPKMALM